MPGNHKRYRKARAKKQNNPPKMNQTNRKSSDNQPHVTENSATVGEEQIKRDNLERLDTGNVKLEIKTDNQFRERVDDDDPARTFAIKTDCVCSATSGEAKETEDSEKCSLQENNSGTITSTELTDVKISKPGPKVNVSQPGPKVQGQDQLMINQEIFSNWDTDPQPKNTEDFRPENENISVNKPCINLDNEATEKIREVNQTHSPLPRRAELQHNDSGTCCAEFGFESVKKRPWTSPHTNQENCSSRELSDPRLQSSPFDTLAYSDQVGSSVDPPDYLGSVKNSGDITHICSLHLEVLPSKEFPKVNLSSELVPGGSAMLQCDVSDSFGKTPSHKEILNENESSSEVSPVNSMSLAAETRSETNQQLAECILKGEMISADDNEIEQSRDKCFLKESSGSSLKVNLESNDMFEETKQQGFIKRGEKYDDKARTDDKEVTSSEIKSDECVLKFDTGLPEDSLKRHDDTGETRIPCLTTEGNSYISKVDDSEINHLSVTSDGCLPPEDIHTLTEVSSIPDQNGPLGCHSSEFRTTAVDIDSSVCLVKNTTISEMNLRKVVYAVESPVQSCKPETKGEQHNSEINIQAVHENFSSTLAHRLISDVLQECTCTKRTCDLSETVCEDESPKESHFGAVEETESDVLTGGSSEGFSEAVTADSGRRESGSSGSTVRRSGSWSGGNSLISESGMDKPSVLVDGVFEDLDECGSSFADDSSSLCDRSDSRSSWNTEQYENVSSYIDSLFDPLFDTGDTEEADDNEAGREGFETGEAADRKAGHSSESECQITRETPLNSDLHRREGTSAAVPKMQSTPTELFTNTQQKSIQVNSLHEYIHRGSISIDGSIPEEPEVEEEEEEEHCTDSNRKMTDNIDNSKSGYVNADVSLEIESTYPEKYLGQADPVSTEVVLAPTHHSENMLVFASNVYRLYKLMGVLYQHTCSHSHDTCDSTPRIVIHAKGSRLAGAAIQSLDSLNDQIVQYIFAQNNVDLDLEKDLSPRERDTLKSSMVLIRGLLIDAQSKFRKMVDDNRQLAVKIDSSIQAANQEVTVLRAELADTNKRLSQITVSNDLKVDKATQLEGDNWIRHKSDEENALTKVKEENGRLEAQVKSLMREVQELKLVKAASSEQPSYGELKLELIQTRQEVNRAKEALQAMKADRKRLKGEKLDLLNQMKQLYSTLEDKESELRDFIRNYEQRVRESDDTIKQLAMEKEDCEREKWRIIKKAQEAAERAVLLRSQCDDKDQCMKKLESELAEMRSQPLDHNKSCMSEADRTCHSVTSTTASEDLPPYETPSHSDASRDDSFSVKTSTPSHDSRLNSLTNPNKLLNTSHDLNESDSSKKRHRIPVFGSLTRMFSKGRLRRSIALPHGETFDDPGHPKLALLSPDNYQEKLAVVSGLKGVHITNWKASQVLAWLEISLAMPTYGKLCAENIKSGKVLLGLSDSDLSAALGITNSIHRRKLRLAIEEQRDPGEVKYTKAANIDHTWVSHRWLSDLGLPQYSSVFETQLADGRILNQLSKKDLEKHFNVHRKFHQASVLHAVELLRLLNFDKESLLERRSQCEDANADPLVWTNERVVQWIKSIELGEYVQNLKESGVHGALMVLEPSFTADTLSTALGIPPSKSYLRRHIATELEALIKPARVALDTPNNNTKHRINGTGSVGRSFIRSYRSASLDDGGPKSRLSFRGSLGRAFGRKIKDDLRMTFDSDTTPKSRRGIKISDPIPITHNHSLDSIVEPDSTTV